LEPSGIPARVGALASEAGFSFFEARQLAGDVGHRVYFRLFGADNRTALAVVYPEAEAEARDRWNRMRTVLSGRVRVPEILADDGETLQILEDFGDLSLSRLWEREDPSARGRIAAQAAEVAGEIAGIPDPGVNPAFDADFFYRELEKSREGFFSAFAGDPLSQEEGSVHDEFARALCREIDAHPRTLVHRDFHVDNLHSVGGEIGVIDFQDARSGPDSYDIASLTRERATLLAPDAQAERAACDRFAARLGPAAAGLRERLPRVRLQRAWKAAGTFARAAAEGRGELYRKFLPAQLSLVEELLAPGGAEGEFAAILRRRSAKLFPWQPAR